HGPGPCATSSRSTLSRSSSGSRRSSTAPEPKRSARARRRVDALRHPPHPALLDELSQRAEHDATNVLDRERVEVAGSERAILDRRPVQRLARLPQYGKDGLPRLHQRTAGRTREANRSTCAG